MRGRVRNGQGRGRSKGGSGPCSTVMLLSWTVILGWGAFLFYSYHYGVLAPKLPSMGEMNRFINDTEALVGHITHIDLSPKHGMHSDGVAPPGSSSSVAVPGTPERDIDSVHIVFSTDCTPYQDWQTLVMFHSAKVVGQIGPITRIASGCDDAKKAELLALYAKLWPQYHIHFTPDFKKDGKTKKKYDFYNKPYGMKHWLENADPPVQAGQVIALLDPDMILVRPISTKMRGQPNNIVSRPVLESEIFERVEHGKPVGQTYGLGAPWVNDNHKKFNRGKICGEGSPCLDVPNEKEGWKYFSVGPPYILERDDFLKLCESWTLFVPRVYENYPYLLAEMYAYSMAAAHEELGHLRMDHFMVSNTFAGGEGWPWVDALEDACLPPDANGHFQPDVPLPSVVHFCQNYRVGDLQFAKRKMSKTVFTCDSPLLVEPPINLGKVTYRYKNGKREDLDQKQVKRNAYILCTVYRSINAAVTDYKQRMCSGQSNTTYVKTLSYRG